MTKDKQKDLEMKDEEEEVGAIQELPEESMLEESVDDFESKWLRALADYQNLKKSTQKEKEDWIKFAAVGFIQRILPVVDHFKLAVKHVPEDQRSVDWVEGIFHIKKQLEDLLKDLGVEEIKTVGEKFNPEFHEAISQVEAEGKDEDEIIEEVQVGYIYQGRVIRPAKVIVAK